MLPVLPAVPPRVRRAAQAAVATAGRRAAAWTVVALGFAAVGAARAAYVLAGLAPTVATSAGLDAAAVALVVLAYAVASRGEAARPEGAAPGPRGPRPVRSLARVLAAAGLLALAEAAAGAAGAAAGSVGGGVVRGLTAAASGLALGVAEAAFAVALVLGLRPLVLFRRGRWTVGLWRAALAAVIVSALAWAGSRIDAAPAGPAVAFDAAAIVFGIALVLRQRWVTLLSGRERLAAAGLVFALFAALVGLLALRTVGAGGLSIAGSPERIPASYVLSRSVGGLASLAMGLGAMYSLTAGLVLLFGLPAAEPARAGERRAFQALAGFAGSVLDRTALVQAIARGPVEAGLADAAWVVLSDLDRGDLTARVAAAEGLTVDAAAAAADSDALARAAGAVPLVLGRAEADHRVHARPGSGLGSLVVLPLAARGEAPRGALIAARRTPDAYEADDVAALDAFAAQAALALANADLVAGALDRERLARELALAREVQLRLFPQSLPSLPGLDIAADERPAREIGGDYYDAITLSETCAGIIVADVSGKGTAAAFHMAELKGIFGVGARLTRAPAEFLCRASEALAPSLRVGTFVSAAYGVVDAAEGTLAVARAGHCPPVLARDPALAGPDGRGGGARLLRGRGVALGLGSPALFRRTLDEQTVTLAPGDAVLFYTDGLVEARDAAGEEWGYARLLAAAERHRTLPARALLDALLAEHRAWSATPDAPADDVTVVVMKWRDAPGGPAPDTPPVPSQTPALSPPTPL